MKQETAQFLLWFILCAIAFYNIGGRIERRRQNLKAEGVAKINERFRPAHPFTDRYDS